MKYFFSSQLQNSSGKDESSISVRAKIRKIINSEDSKKPLSDNKIALLLRNEGIKVARRTITKYRESMHIPPSNKRKK